MASLHGGWGEGLAVGTVAQASLELATLFLLQLATSFSIKGLEKERGGAKAKTFSRQDV